MKNFFEKFESVLMPIAIAFIIVGSSMLIACLFKLAEMLLTHQC